MTDEFALPVNDVDWQPQELAEDIPIAGDFVTPLKPSDKWSMTESGGVICIPAYHRGQPGNLRVHGRISSGRIWHAYKASWEAFPQERTVPIDSVETSAPVSQAISVSHRVLKFCVTGLREGIRWRNYSAENADRVVLDRAAVHTEAKLYCGRLQPLQGSVVPRFHGLWKASLHSREVYAMILEYVPSDIAMPLSSQEL